MKIIKTFETFLGSDQKNILPEPAQTELKTYIFKVPVKVKLEFDDNVFNNYSDIDDISNAIERDGLDNYWLVPQFNKWKEYKEDEIGEEPEIEDFDDEDDYNAEWKDWDERKSKLDSSDSDLLYDFAKDEFGSWDSFVNEFKIEERINDAMDAREQKEIFDELKDSFNEDDLNQYFDDAEKLGISYMNVEGNNFDDEGRFYVYVKSSNELNDSELNDVKDYLEGQFSDGWGEGFEQNEIDDWSVYTWWNDKDYEIEIEK